MREDALAKLDQFKRRTPELFDNRFRIEHLTTEQGREAITEPLERWWDLCAQQVRAEKQLVDQVLVDVWVGRDYFHEESALDIAQGSQVVGPPNQSWQVEAPFL